MAGSDLTEQILLVVRDERYRPISQDDLAESMQIAAHRLGEFESACRGLIRSGQLTLGRGGTLRPKRTAAWVTGTFRAHARGFGFVVPTEPTASGDLYVPATQTGGAVSGDTVTARVVKAGKRRGAMVHEGRIESIVARGHSRFVGELKRSGRRWCVVPDGNILHAPIVVEDPGAKVARAGEQVVVDITEYPTQRAAARGAIVSVLGRRGDPDVDVRSIIEQYGLPEAFDDETMSEARAVVDAFRIRTAMVGREDLRDRVVITIDPRDAKDFDDAVSIQSVGGDCVELGVHIADVAHFVRSGGALDRSAYERCNSVYLPRCVIPMLPEVLSNGLCSLQAGRTRLTQSVFVTYDRRARVVDSRIAASVIRSSRRLTYEQAQRILNGRPGRASAEVVHLLQAAAALASSIRARRRRDGMLELDLPQAELVYDEEGRAVDVRQADASFTHKLIEMFMVEANEVVARRLTEAGLPHLRRIHDAPDPRDLKSLDRSLAMLGYRTSGGDRAGLQAVLDAAQGRDTMPVVHLAVLRSMRQAEYSRRAIGHYALASTAYCHFTSPIRRYADLTIHRQIAGLHRRNASGRSAPAIPPCDIDLAMVGRRCTENQRRAESAERELTLVLVLRILRARIGQVLGGRVTGFTNAGVFVQLDHFQIDGLVRFETLGRDRWSVGRDGLAAVAARGGRRIALGDRADVRIRAIDLATRQMELTVSRVENLTHTGGRNAAAKGSGERILPLARARTGRKGKRTQALGGARSARRRRRNR